MSSVDLDDVYFAGLFDGEGCVTAVLKNGRALSMWLTIGNKHHGVLEYGIRKYGGTLTPNGSVRNWQIYGMQAERFARAIEPYSIIKRPQLLKFLEGRKLLNEKGRTGLTDENVAARFALVKCVAEQKHEYI